MEDAVRLLQQRDLLAPIPNFDNVRREENQPTVESNVLLVAVHIVLEIQAADVNPREDNAFLIFLPGLGEIQEMKDTFMKFDTSSFWILPLHSTITSEEQSQVFKRAPKGIRKIILATNIAESSVTVPDIRYVIDLGFVKEIYFDPQTNLESLKLQFASKASAVQRQGRAGRVGPGTVFRMYTQDFYDKVMSDYSTSEMLRCPLESLVLRIKIMKEDLDVLDQAIQPPNTELLNQAVVNLRNAGGLDWNDQITFVGSLFASLPLDIKLSRLVILGHVFGYTSEIIDIAANISLRGVFTRSFNQPYLAYASKLAWSQQSESDSLASLLALNAFRNVNPNQREQREFCRFNFLHYNTIQELEDLSKELKMRLKSHVSPNEKPVANLEERSTFLKAIIFGAFYPNYYSAEYTDKREFQAIERNLWHGVKVDPFRSVILSGLPHDITEANIRELLKTCGKISQVHIQMGNKAFVEFSDQGDSKGAVILAQKLGVMKKLVWDSKRGSVFVPHDNNPRYNNNKKNDPEEEITHGEGQETNLPSLILNNWGVKVLSIPTHAFRINFEARNYKQVVIDVQSVNSITLDHSDHIKECETSNEFEEAAASTRRYLAAAFVSSTGTWQERQLARETTMLPPIPLMGPILAVIFCPSPDCYFWPNRRKSYYLGVTLQDGLMEFSFTHMFNNADLVAVNELRHLISVSLTKDGIHFDNSEEIRDKLWRLLHRKRKPIRPRRKPRDSDTMPKKDGGEVQLLLMPIVPKVTLIHSTDGEDEYDSEEGEKEKRKKQAHEIKTRFNVSEPEFKSVACIKCHEPVANLVTLEKQEEEAGKYILTRCFGMAYTLPDFPHYFGCRNLHPIGFEVESEYIIDSTSPLEVQIPGSDTVAWCSEVWKDNFASIGGPAVEAKKETPITEEALYCDICNYQAHEKSGFVHLGAYINSKAHREEEKYFISTE